MVNKSIIILIMYFLIPALLSPSVYAGDEEMDNVTYDLLVKRPDNPKPPLPFKQVSDPAPGKFLIAGRQMGDTRFREAVILLISYDLEGAMGVIINKPTKLKISEAFPEIKGFSNKGDLIFWGGPVEMHKAFMLIRSKDAPKDTIRVLDDVHFGVSQEILEGISNSSDSSERSRVYLGYAGWARGQLDREILRGGWRVMNGDAESVFSAKPENIWNKFILLDPSQQVMAR
jgi:putative transcriptional regulator